MSQALADASSGGGASGGSSSRRAPRGAACLNCRRRKMRCDGGRPVCGQCIRTGREADCEYTDGPGPSPTQVLEEQIARLESRIRELEHPELVAPSVTLNPTHGQGPALGQPQALLAGAPNIPMLGRIGTPDPLPLMIPGAFGQPGGPTPALSQDPLMEPPVDLVRTLVNAFLPHVSSLGFFLHVPHFMQFIQLPAGDPRRAQLSPALLNAVYLWGAHLSTSQNIRAYEATFLTRATSALSSALRDSHYTVMNLIQAELLMANYFFTTSRFLEGRYHCSAAVALVLSCRLGKIRSSADQGHGHGVQGRENNLPPPRDAIEEGERIRGFWYVYALDKTWAVALGSPSHFNGAHTGSHVDTPWPLEMAQYEAGGMAHEFRSALTVHNFVSGAASVPYAGRDSQLSLRAKAATLFERATNLASQWSPNIDRNEFYGKFMALDGLIDRFTASLPPIERSGNPDVALTSLVTHTLTRAATIQLRSNFKDYDRMSDRKDFAAAQAVAALLDNLNLPPTNIDPILAILWTAISRVLIASAGPSTARTPQRDAIRAMLDRVLGAMNRFRDASPLMGMIHDGFVSLLAAMN
ncbi:hypothetical protein L227DRAFT_502556 [Lentinus tigrinus ALCF2SS1-6]|uniref:Zn(2)-C6 fungal-type domain-containing protein n=1 Tax=Lentinus tigrinus ALCF2SS1-6 TaxID=1328759 RepID=A0A5C2S8V6_9APHY|nr:hypothetical protein L227DRAFT_502556 [Lentinus tigrinus ALCF2SS1-6]